MNNETVKFVDTIRVLQGTAIPLGVCNNSTVEEGSTQNSPLFSEQILIFRAQY